MSEPVNRTPGQPETMHTTASWRRTAFTIAPALGVVEMSHALVVPFLPLYARELGITDRAELALWAGILAGAPSIMAGLASPLWGLLADRFGRKRMLIRSITFGALGLAAIAFATAAGQVLAVRLLQGLLTGSNAAASMFLAAVLPRARTGSVFGLMYTFVQIGQLLGPLLGGILIISFGLRATFMIAASILITCAGTVGLLAREGARPPMAHVPALRLTSLLAPFRSSRLRGGLLVTLAVAMVLMSTNAQIAVYVLDLTRPTVLSRELAVGLAIGLGALAAAIAMPILGSLADTRDARAMLASGIAVMAISLIPQALARDVVVLIGGRAFTGIGLAAVTSSLAVINRAAAPAGAEGRVFAALGTAQNFGWGFGPLAGAWVAASLGIPVLYGLSAALLLAVAVLVVLGGTWFPPESACAANRAHPVPPPVPG